MLPLLLWSCPPQCHSDTSATCQACTHRASGREQSIKNETNVSICAKKKQWKTLRKKVSSLLCQVSSYECQVKVKSSLSSVLLVSYVILKSSNLRLESGLNQVMWLESSTSVEYILGLCIHSDYESIDCLRIVGGWRMRSLDDYHAQPPAGSLWWSLSVF